MTYQPGDTIEINGTTVTLTCRRSFSGSGTGQRWSWVIPNADLYGETAEATAEDAIAHATRTIQTGECRHGSAGWCPTCHDSED